jgi:hypothetical protein
MALSNCRIRGLRVGVGVGGCSLLSSLIGNTPTGRRDKARETDRQTEREREIPDAAPTAGRNLPSYGNTRLLLPRLRARLGQATSIWPMLQFEVPAAVVTDAAVFRGTASCSSMLTGVSEKNITSIFRVDYHSRNMGIQIRKYTLFQYCFILVMTSLNLSR